MFDKVVDLSPTMFAEGDMPSNQLRTLVLAAIVFTVLFVLISPLPEPDSTGPNNFLIAVLLMMAVGQISMISAVDALPSRPPRSARAVSDLLAALCSRQC